MRVEFKQSVKAADIFRTLALVANKGQNVYVEWTRDAKTRKDSQVVVTKTVRAQVRYGVNYANMGAIRDGIEAGEREEVQPLAWGHWRKGYVNRIIDHNGVEYCRFACGTFANVPRHVSYTLNGKPATFEQVKPHLLASELPSDEKPLVFNLRAETITAVGNPE